MPAIEPHSNRACT